MMNFNEAMGVEIQGVPPPLKGTHGAGVDAVTPGFFQTMRIPLVAGRDFRTRDSAANAPVAIVNQAFARHFLPNRDPLGERIVNGSELMRIVGVVADVRQRGLLNAPMPTVYTPYAQHPTAFVSLVIRTGGNPRAIVSALRAQAQQLDGELPVFAVETMDQRLSGMIAPQRFEMVAVSVFALVALLLAALGTYGVISYSVAERTHEIGIRMALGAGRSAVVGMVVRTTLLLALAGVAIGIAGSLALTRYLASLLYGVRPDDPWAFSLAAAVLILAAVLAGYLPARRAMRVDPIAALRHQ
jgi:putative ABC transport system permease protein